jgi:hypothetical protein
MKAHFACLANSWSVKFEAARNPETSMDMHLCGVQPHHVPLSTGQEYNAALGQVHLYFSLNQVTKNCTEYSYLN